MQEGFSYPEFGPGFLNIKEADRKPRTVRQLLIDIASRQDLGGVQNLEALREKDWKVLDEACITKTLPRWEAGNSPGGDGDANIVYENEISFHDYTEALNRIKGHVRKAEVTKKEEDTGSKRLKIQEDYDVRTTQWRFPKCGHIYSRGGIMAEVALRNMPLISGQFPTVISCACGNTQSIEKVRNAILAEGYPVPKDTGGNAKPPANEKPTASTN